MAAIKSKAGRKAQGGRGGAGRGRGPTEARKAAPRQEWHGVAVTSIYRHLGHLGANGAQAMDVVKGLGLKPNLNTAYSNVGAGRTGSRGGAPKLDAEVAGKLKAKLAAVKKAD